MGDVRVRVQEAGWAAHFPRKTGQAYDADLRVGLYATEQEAQVNMRRRPDPALGGPSRPCRNRDRTCSLLAAPIERAMGSSVILGTGRGWRRYRLRCVPPLCLQASLLQPPDCRGWWICCA